MVTVSGHFRSLGTHVLANRPARFGFKSNKRDIWLDANSCAFPFSQETVLVQRKKNLLKWTWLFTNNHCLPWQVWVPEHVSQHEINGKSISLSICHQYLLALSRKNVCTCSTDDVSMWSEWSDFNVSWAVAPVLVVMSYAFAGCKPGRLNVLQIPALARSLHWIFLFYMNGRLCNKKISESCRFH